MRALLILYLTLFLSVFSIQASEDWGRTGHRTTGEIAEKHLSRKAKKAIDKLLNGQSLAFVSTYGDEIKSDDQYRSYGPWHYVNFPFGTTYGESMKSEKGDLVTAIGACVAVLKNENSTHAEKVFHLKMLVHFMGDLHQPLHVGIGEDRGGNQFQVRWFDEGTNLHTVWDTKMIEDYNMSYTELAANTNRLSKQNQQAIERGNVLDWVAESRTLCETVYANTKSGEKLGYKYMYDYVNIVRSQLQKGGIRLAVVLNDIFE